uniref:Uncharacterized protein n=1 Tax=Rhizophora mucronata TaxID=61149 RepID=A0A2P2PWB3_RHIMU
MEDGKGSELKGAQPNRESKSKILKRHRMQKAQHFLGRGTKSENTTTTISTLITSFIKVDYINSRCTLTDLFLETEFTQVFLNCHCFKININPFLGQSFNINKLSKWECPSFILVKVNWLQSLVQHHTRWTEGNLKEKS